MTPARRLRVVGFACAVTLALVAGVGHAAQEEIPGDWIDARGDQPELADLASSAMRLASADGVWVGYSFALRPGVHIGCDTWKGHHFSLGGGDVHLYFDDERGTEEQNVPCDEPFGVFLRFADDAGEVAAARMMTIDRAGERLDKPVVWAGAYDADDSVAYLSGAVLEDRRGAISTDSEKVRERLLAAVAVHDSGAAESVVYDALEPEQPRDLRDNAVFWVTQVAEDQGVERLLDLARNDADREIREQSIFWLGQLAGEVATAHLTEIAESDPDTEVRQSAVFALSQSEDDAAIDALIRIVRAHQNPEVVRAAMFWLGQSGDSRALALFEELLFGRRD